MTEDALLALHAVIVVVLAWVVRILWKVTERLSRVEGRLNGRND